MSHSIEYDVYWNLLFVPITVAYTVCYAALGIAFSYSLFKKCYEKQVSQFVSGFIKFTSLGNLTREEVGPGEKRYLLFGHPVAPFQVRYQFAASLVTWLAMFLAFWSTFLLEVTDSCNDNFDCFYTETSNNRIEDCQLVNTSQSIQCFRFRLDMIRGVGAAGGVQGLMITLQYGQIILYAWLKKKISRSTSNKLKWKLTAASVATGLLLFEILVFIVNTAFIYSDIFPAKGTIRTLTWFWLFFLMLSLIATSLATTGFLFKIKRFGMAFNVKSSQIDLVESVSPYSLMVDDEETL